MSSSDHINIIRTIPNGKSNDSRVMFLYHSDYVSLLLRRHPACNQDRAGACELQELLCDPVRCHNLEQTVAADDSGRRSQTLGVDLQTARVRNLSEALLLGLAVDEV